MKLGTKGQAAVLAVAIVVSGASIGAPLAVDQADVNPDHPLYGLEKAGERMKRFLATDKDDFDAKIAEERMQEARYYFGKRKDNLGVRCVRRSENIIENLPPEYCVLKQKCAENGVDLAVTIVSRNPGAAEEVLKEVDEMLEEVGEDAKAVIIPREKHRRMERRFGRIHGKLENLGERHPWIGRHEEKARREKEEFER